MSDESQSLPNADLSVVLASYLQAVDDGQMPDPDALLERYPHLADDLRAFLAAERRLAQVAGPLCEAETPNPNAETVWVEGGRTSEVPEVGAVFGHYEILAEIAHGGMGVVFHARDKSLGREVAIKVLAGDFAPDSAAAERFAREAQITGLLQHPGIPPVHVVGTLPDGRPFLAMKLIRGRTLDALSRERPDPAAEHGPLLAVFEQVCQAVGYAHSMGIIHRDLKPANIMVGAFGEVQVMDWGLAKELARRAEVMTESKTAKADEARPDGETSSATRSGSVIGTASYMPPEQAGGEIDKLDERADVFGLGAILCVVLTGRPPYTAGSTQQILAMARRAELGEAFRRLDDCKAEAELVALCKRCLSAERDARPRDGGEVAKAMAEFRLAAEDRARQADLDRVRTTVELRELEMRLAVEKKRRRARQAFAGAIGLLVLFGVGFAWWTNRQAALYTRGNNLFEQDDPEGAIQNYKEALESSGIVPRWADLRKSDPDWPPKKSVEPWEMQKKDPPALREPLELRRFVGHTGVVRGIVISADGKLAVSCSGDGTIRVWDVATGNELRQLRGHKRELHAVRFVGKGQQVLGSEGGVMRLWNAHTGELVREFPKQTGDIYSLDVSPDGLTAVLIEMWLRTVLPDQSSSIGLQTLGITVHGRDMTGADARPLYAWEVETGRQKGTRLMTANTHRVLALAVSADGKRVLTGGATPPARSLDDIYTDQKQVLDGEDFKNLLYIELESGKVLRQFPHGFGIEKAVFSPDGKFAVSAGFDGPVVQWDLQTGKPVREFPGQRKWAQDVSFSPDGSLLATAGNDGTIRLWEFATGKELYVYRAHTEAVLTVRFTPDGRQLISGGGSRTDFDIRVLAVPEKLHAPKQNPPAVTPELAPPPRIK